jgi:hypothetical protein
MAEAGAIVKKYQNQTVIPHVKEFFSGKENAGSPKMKILFFFFFFFFFFFQRWRATPSDVEWRQDWRRQAQFRFRVNIDELGDVLNAVAWQERKR